jgi:tRNA(His) guanylyltransferase
MKDALGDRMKSYYEGRSKVYLPRRTNTIIRIDGKAFHTYTRGLKRPFDTELIYDMDETTKFLCANIQGAKLGYVQSDEISILLTDFDQLTTDAWFDGNVQKMCSISASLATAKFNQLRMKRSFGGGIALSEEYEKFKLAHFDSRVFIIPSKEEVINYFIWRQQDATRNSISSVAQSLYSHKELNGVTTDQMQELIFQKGQNWNDYSVGQKRGRLILKKTVYVDSTEDRYNKSKDKDGWVVNVDSDGKPYSWRVARSAWNVVETPIFTQDKSVLRDVIPPYEISMD